MKRPIHPGLAPNVEKEDFLLSVSKIINPISYNRGSQTNTLEQWFEKYYQEKAFAFSSARGALFAVLVSLGITKGDEVLVTGFTCVAVVDGVLATGAKPVYVDIQKDFTLDFSDLRKKTSDKTKVLIVQHTFGISNITKDIVAFAKSKKIHLVEDVAHGIGLKDKNVLLEKYALPRLPG